MVVPDNEIVLGIFLFSKREKMINEQVMKFFPFLFIEKSFRSDHIF